jgi:G3E family GTPase
MIDVSYAKDIELVSRLKARIDGTIAELLMLLQVEQRTTRPAISRTTTSMIVISSFLAFFLPLLHVVVSSFFPIYGLAVSGFALSAVSGFALSGSLVRVSRALVSQAQEAEVMIQNKLELIEGLRERQWLLEDMVEEAQRAQAMYRERLQERVVLSSAPASQHHLQANPATHDSHRVRHSEPHDHLLGGRRELETILDELRIKEEMAKDQVYSMDGRIFRLEARVQEIGRHQVEALELSEQAESISSVSGPTMWQRFCEFLEALYRWWQRSTQS